VLAYTALKPVFGLVFQTKPTLLFFAQLHLQSSSIVFFVGKLSDVIKSVMNIIRPYFSKIIMRSGINPSTASHLHFHFINRRTNNFLMAYVELVLMIRPKKYSILLLMSVSILPPPIRPLAADPEIPESSDCAIRQNIFWIFSSLENCFIVKYHNSHPYSRCGRAILLHS
jgi:diadenosine tetraphosphate (Ap4A) HIT family hydrolase